MASNIVIDIPDTDSVHYANLPSWWAKLGHTPTLHLDRLPSWWAKLGHTPTPENLDRLPSILTTMGIKLVTHNEYVANIGKSIL